MKRPRSAAQIAASRRNGARSRGPKSALAKARSSANAVKHGLFSVRTVLPSDLPQSLAMLADTMETLSGDRPDLAFGVEAVLLAGLRHDEATLLLSALHARLDAMLHDAACPPGDIADLVTQVTRMARHQQRFRRARDRALERLIEHAAP